MSRWTQPGSVERLGGIDFGVGSSTVDKATGRCRGRVTVGHAWIAGVCVGGSMPDATRPVTWQRLHRLDLTVGAGRGCVRVDPVYYSSTIARIVLAVSGGKSVDQAISPGLGFISASGDGSGCQSSGATPGTQSNSRAKILGSGTPSAMIAR